MDIKRLKDHLLIDLQTDVVPLVVGSTGIGKSESIEQVAKELGYSLIDLRLGECGESADAFGLPTVITNGDGNKRTEFTVPNWWPHGEDVQKPHLLFLDEINRAPDRDTMQTVFKLLLKKEFHDRKLPNTWKVMAAMNPENDDNYFVQGMDLALQTRFIRYDVTCSSKGWIEWAYKNGVHSQILDFISVHPESLHNPTGKNNPRTWTQFSKLIFKMEETNNMDMMYEKACGLLDAGTAAVFRTFVDGNLQKPIPAKDILMRYPQMKKRLITLMKGNHLDVVHATVTELSNTKIEVTDKVVSHLKQFILDLPKEIGYKMVKEFMDKEEYDELFRKLTSDKEIEKLIDSVDYA